jgi:hypothetical protein
MVSKTTLPEPSRYAKAVWFVDPPPPEDDVERVKLTSVVEVPLTVGWPTTANETVELPAEFCPPPALFVEYRIVIWEKLPTRSFMLFVK